MSPLRSWTALAGLGVSTICDILYAERVKTVFHLHVQTASSGSCMSNIAKGVHVGVYVFLYIYIHI